MMDAEEWMVSLPSWRDGSARRSVIAFLQEITQGPGALPVADRVAAFDNDGTLACEKPHTALAGFLLDRAAAAGSAPPEVASGHDVLRELGVLFAGQTTAQYDEQARRCSRRRRTHTMRRSTRSSTIPTPSGTVTQPLNSTINVPDSFPVAGSERPAQHHRRQRSRPRGLPDRARWDDGPVVQERRRHRHEGQLHEHGLQRQRDDLDPGRRCSVLRLVPARAGRAGSSRRSSPATSAVPINSSGNWTLRVIDDKSDGIIGTLNSWSLTLTKSVPIDGLGEPVADQATVSFQIFSDGPDRPAVEHDLDGGRADVDQRRRPVSTVTRARSARSPSIPPTPRATRSTPPAPAAASGRRPTS